MKQALSTAESLECVLGDLVKVSTLQCSLSSAMSDITTVQDDLDEAGDVLPVGKLSQLRAALHEAWKLCHEVGDVLEDRQTAFEGEWGRLVENVKAMESEVPR